jgi:hypothetical protein
MTTPATVRIRKAAAGEWLPAQLGYPADLWPGVNQRVWSGE